ncbi:MAG: phage late control D family protein [Deltaproteobacteria bacterium]|nr:phage late control D family protein [Deltaproteobacteria bacterium]
MPEQDSQVRSAASYEIVIAGTTYTQRDRLGVESLTIEDHVDMVSMLTMEVGGAEGQPAWTFEIGQEVTAKVGDMTAVIFKGEITALEPSWSAKNGARIVVRALDPLHKLGRGRQSRAFPDQTDSDVVSTVAGDCGLNVEVDTTSPTHPYILQRNESNISFVKRLAARNNFLLRLDRETLLFKKNQYTGDEVTLTNGANVQSLRISANTADLADKVVVRGWDPLTKQAVVGEASSVTSVGGGTTGIDLAKTKFGEHTSYVTDVPVTDQNLATAIATAELERIARQFVRGNATIYGNDRVRAGTNVVLAEFNSPWDGKYFVMASRHVIGSGDAYLTEFTFCSNSFGS